MKSNKSLLKISALLIIIILSISTSIAQRKLNKAREYKDNYQYSNALTAYNEHFKSSTPRKSDDIRDIAHCYLMMNDIGEAQKWLSKINSMSVYNSAEMMNYVNVLKSSGEYENAIIQYKRYADLFPDRSLKLPKWIESCKQAEYWIANPMSYDVTNVEGINSKNSDFGLIPYNNGFIYSSDRLIENKQYDSKEIFGWTGNPYLKMFSISALDEDKAPNESALMEGINSTFHNGPGVFDKTSDRIYYTLTKIQKTKALPSNSDPTSWEDTPIPDSYVNRLEIYSAKLVNNKWEDIKPFEYNNSEEYSIGHPSISADGKTMYFVSNMPGGYGNSDIYYSLLQADGKWSSPVNAGATINTEDKEVFPVLDKDGTLYFSSDGHSGMGGLDIFETHGDKNKWSTPENMQYPINSPKDDFLPYFTTSGVRGYLSSNREGGKGEDDIYYFSKKLMIYVTTLERVKDKMTIPLGNVKVKFEDLIKEDSTQKVTDENGIWVQKENCGAVYEITASKQGYFQQAKSIYTTSNRSNDTMYVDLILDKIEENKSYAIENIYYDFDKWDIRTDASVELDKLVKTLNEYPNIDIELGSHTDARGTNIYNNNLSQKRAESAVEYIISKGIDKHRITAKGYGKTKLINKCADGVDCPEAEHQLNRRTEFTVTKIHK